MKPVYWLSPLAATDDFGARITDEFIDGKTRYGPWAIMTPGTWAFDGVARTLGQGVGQRYRRQPDGRWLKVEG